LQRLAVKATAAAPAAAAPPKEATTAPQPAAAAEDSLFIRTRPIAPCSVFLPYIFNGIHSVKKNKIHFNFFKTFLKFKKLI
jgi:hypothetical protein